MQIGLPLTNTFVFLRPLERVVNPVFSAIGAFLGIAGTALLAIDPRHVTSVFLCYAISNVAWIVVAVRTRQWWLLAMNGVYLSISAFGLLR